ncbi:MAG: T9SS type A sorting domain-containing protein [Cyclobacteriaceae bacterium]|nr:T9SS type A sorting domain-containing protein [Cyclobacteriaceae bacterium]
MTIKRTILFLILTFGLFVARAQDTTSDTSVESPKFENSALEIKNQIDIYPNPSVNFLVIEIKNSELERVEFEMRSIIGNKVNIFPEEIGLNKYRINVKDFSTGYYFLVIIDEFTRFKEAHKFLKK